MADVERKFVLESSFEITWSKIHEIPIECTSKAFFDSVNVWIDKPHVANRRLSGSIMLKRVCLPHENCKDLIKFACVTGSEITAEDISSKIDKYLNCEDVSDDNSSFEIILRRLLPRLMAKSERLVEMVFIGKNTVNFFF